MLKLTTASLLTIVLCYSCSKSSDEPPLFTRGIDIYMAGSDSGGRAVYWKNGERVQLVKGVSANAIQVVGSDVYVGGEIYDNGRYTAAYWKNDQLFRLETPHDSYVKGIAVVGDDVYCVGHNDGSPGSQSDTAVYWKNNVKFNLSQGVGGIATAIRATGSSIYITGRVWGSSDTAVVWKNFVQYNYNMPGDMSALGFSGADSFFVSGYTPGAAYWKNGFFQSLDPSGFASSIAFDGADVYIGGGNANPGGGSSAAYWKNGELVKLTSTYELSYVFAMAVAGSDIYAGGMVYDKANAYDSPVYWKNGTIMQIGNSGAVWAIVCVPK